MRGVGASLLDTARPGCFQWHAGYFFYFEVGLVFFGSFLGIHSQRAKKRGESRASGFAPFDSLLQGSLAGVFVSCRRAES